jgi:hypothetical protein
MRIPMWLVFDSVWVLQEQQHPLSNDCSTTRLHCRALLCVAPADYPSEKVKVLQGRTCRHCNTHMLVASQHKGTCGDQQACPAHGRRYYQHLRNMHMPELTLVILQILQTPCKTCCGCSVCACQMHGSSDFGKCILHFGAGN